MTTPISILRESIKAVPAVKYALGLAGLASVIAIIRSFNLDYRVAVIGTVIMLLFMTLLVIFARLSSLAAPDFRLPALVFAWFSLIFMIAIAFSMFSSVFFRQPIDLQDWIKPVSPQPQITTPKLSYAKEPAETAELTNEAASPDTLVVLQGMRGPDTGSDASPVLNPECPEITFVDNSKIPPESHKEHRCVP